MEVSEDDDDNNNDVAAKRCFSQIQSRKFWTKLEPECCRLCPSMDLIVLGASQQQQQQQQPSALSSTNNSHNNSPSPKMTPPTAAAAAASPIVLSIHRTVSWQKLATMEGAGSADIDDEATIPMTPSKFTPVVLSTLGAAATTTHVSWSPDGRLLAVAGAQVELYDVEALASTNTSTNHGNDGAAAAIENSCIMTWVPTTPNTKQQQNMIPPLAVLGLIWAHVGRPHPSCHITEDEVEENVSISYASRYLFRATTFLPPSGYHTEDKPNGEESMDKNDLKSLPTCRTPLSVLCIASAEYGILLLLHGRYHILTLDERPSGPTTMVCSSDLTHLVAHVHDSKKLSLFSFPYIGKYRFYLQTISAFYCSIWANIKAIQRQCTETAASWKSSLKPLDQKLEPLVRLLHNYGVTDHVKSVLLQFILVGHTTSLSTLSSAMDQFFTGVQMNDQLLQRMERSVSSGLANVEQNVRRGLLSPARLLVYHSGELSGLARFASDLLPVQVTLQLKERCEILLLCAETMVTQLVEARFRIRDFCDWIRATASHVKARGTATTSVQRENAKKRRVPQAVVQRMIGYLQQQQSLSDSSTPTTTSTPIELGSSLTENLLSLPILAFFHEHPSYVLLQSNSTDATSVNSLGNSRKSPTLPFITNRVISSVNEVFEHPRIWLSKTITKTELTLPADSKGNDDALVKIHHRQGSDCGPIADETVVKGCFAPQISNPMHTNFSFCCRNWTIVATGTKCSANNDGNGIIQLFAIPCPASQASEDSDDDDELNDLDELEEGDGRGDRSTSFVLTTQLILAPLYSLVDMSFYGDDGRSSLSSGTDSGTGMEGRQALGLLVARRESDLPAESEILTAEELWIVRYDDLLYEAIEKKTSSTELLNVQPTLDCCKVILRPLPSDDCEDHARDSGVVFAKTRVIRQLQEWNEPQQERRRLLLSGSRGIGGAMSTSLGITSLELYDLEEDEEVDDAEMEDGEEEQES